MKHRYFGDINDYRKYGLLRALSQATGLSLGICWLLTADDSGTDGEFRRYLHEPERWRQYDPDLYDALQRLRDPTIARSVTHAEGWQLLPGATYYQAVLHDDIEARRAYFRDGWDVMAECPLLFFDPDNGLEVSSVTRGSKDSSKYLYWEEARDAFTRGHSLVVYQHFPRQERTGYTTRLVQEGIARLGATTVDTFATAHVLFLLFAQPEHATGLRQAHDLILSRWHGQIRPVAHVDS